MSRIMCATSREGCELFDRFFFKYSLFKERGDLLTFTEDKFILNGTKMGSAFGYAIEVVDLNNDG